ncbi:MAG: hypothetical protein JNL52_07245 [Flavobacteriales bacterium]|nr:hypothetical protein [Flavobacteriales bacterium]
MSTQRSLLLAGAIVGCSLFSPAQTEQRTSLWSPGGGLGMSLQGPIGLEAHGNYLWLKEPKLHGSSFYMIGPELALGAYFDDRAFTGQRLGLRQIWCPSGYIGLSVTGGVENYTRSLSLEDTRAFVQTGICLIGLFSIEYGKGMPLTNATELPTTDRVVLRIDINYMLAVVFAKVPLS